LNTVWVRQTDTAGNVTASSNITFTLDTKAAAVTAQLQVDSGLATDKITNNPALVI
jgi:hypothetical protein